MKHVLIVEDHEENRRLLKLLLEVNGYRVTAAGDGVEALAAARRDPPDAVVSDALMPNMDGFELCRAWTQDDALKAIPFIFYSATYVRPDDERLGMALGAVRYLIKPLEAEAFLGELRAVLQDWAGRPAPVAAAPLDETAAHALHESALARKLEDKIAQLETAKSKLEQSERRFRNLVEMSSDFYWESDTEHRLMQRSSADKKKSSVSLFERGAQIGERRWEIPHLSPDAAGWAAHRAVLDAHQPFRNFELSRLGTDGTERFISISGDPLFDAAGAFTGYRGVGTDITERKRIERSLLETEELFRQLSGNIPQGFWVRSVDSEKLLYVSPGWQSITGVASPANVREMFAIVHPEDAERVRMELAKAPNGGIDSACRIVHKDGSIRWLHIRTFAVPDQAGEICRVAGVAEDITERKRVEQGLVEGEERFRSLVEQSIAGISIMQDDVTTYVNPRLAEIFGYTPEEMIGQPPTLIVAEEDVPLVVENIRKRKSGELRSLQYTFTGKRKDGSRITIGVHGTIAAVDGRPAIIGIMQDISEKKRAEDQIQLYVAQLENAFMSTVQVATTLGEMRDPYTAGHQRRVAEIAVGIGAELGFDARRQEGLRVAGYLHDIGKIRIPSEILSKPGKLSATEYQLVQGHAQASYDVLKDVGFPWPVAEAALQHHERQDGSGYPQGLKGEAIRIEARIIAVADVIEAMSSHRPYRPGLGLDKALAEIDRGRGSAYDAEVTDACMRLFRERQYQLPE